MKNKEITIKLPIYFDWVNEIIYRSLVIIVFGIAYLFAFNLLRFNWYSVFFGLLTLVMIYLKRGNYLKIEGHQMKIIYFHFWQMLVVDMNQIEQCIFYEETRRVDLKVTDQTNIQLYLAEPHKEALLNQLIQYYPHIAPIYIKNH